MQFLLDENTHFKLLTWFVQSGHDAKRVSEGLKNGNVIELARRESRILITHDKDFGDVSAYPPKTHFGIVIVRMHPPSLPKTILRLEALLKAHSSAELKHKLIFLDEEGYKVVV